MVREHTIARDEFGPEYVLRVHDPRLGMEGFLVIDNTAFGPGKGGIRMTANVSPEEVFRLARTMTWKNALAGIPFGGAKAGIIWPASTQAAARTPGDPDELKKEFIQSFARAIQPFTPRKYIAGPDVGTGEREMQWFVEATGNWRTATGKPATYCMSVFGKEGEKCGIPHEFGSTGFGVAHAANVAAEYVGLPLKSARVAIHGFGNVGTFAYQFLTDMGARIVALADKDGAIYSESGFEKSAVRAAMREKAPLHVFFKEYAVDPKKFWSSPVDILIPASVTDVVNDSNKNLVNAKIIVEAGNIPMRERIEDELFRKGTLIVPDFVANAGGVISSYAEYRGYNPKEMFRMVERKIVKSVREVLERSKNEKRSPRRVAMELSQQKVEERTKEKKQTF